MASEGGTIIGGGEKNRFWQSAARNRLSREAPGSGEDVVVSGEELEHPVHVPGQRVFAADLAHPWEMVDFLQRHKCAQGQYMRCSQKEKNFN